MSNDNKIYVQYGCGMCAPPEWRNFDASLIACCERIPFLGGLYTKNQERFPKNVRYGNIIRGLSFNENTVDGVYASHVLEHMTKEKCLKVLNNTYFILKRGGVFRLIVPNLKARAEKYLKEYDKGNVQASDFFLRVSRFGVEKNSRWFSSLVKYFGHSEHIWMWDRLSIIEALNKVGFQKTRDCTFGDCQDPMFKLVEDEGRFFDRNHSFEEVAVEAIK